MRGPERPCCAYVLRAGSITGRDRSYGTQRCLAQVEEGQVYCPVHRGVTPSRLPPEHADRPQWFAWDDDDAA